MVGSVSSAVRTIGRLAAWCLLALVLVQFAVVLLRYVFSINYLWAQEAALVFHALVFMLAAAWTFRENRHVRIDVLDGRLGTKGRRRLSVLGTCFLLFPMMSAIFLSSLGYVVESWSILEGSTEVSGLPGKFLLKTLIPVFAVLMVVAGVASLFDKTAPADDHR